MGSDYFSTVGRQIGISFTISINYVQSIVYRIKCRGKLFEIKLIKTPYAINTSALALIYVESFLFFSHSVGYIIAVLHQRVGFNAGEYSIHQKLQSRIYVVV